MIKLLKHIALENVPERCILTQNGIDRVISLADFVACHVRPNLSLAVKYSQIICWRLVSRHWPLSPCFVRKFFDYIVWSQFALNSNLPSETIILYGSKLAPQALYASHLDDSYLDQTTNNWSRLASAYSFDTRQLTKYFDRMSRSEAIFDQCLDITHCVQLLDICRTPKKRQRVLAKLLTRQRNLPSEFIDKCLGEYEGPFLRTIVQLPEWYLEKHWTGAAIPWILCSQQVSCNFLRTHPEWKHLSHFVSRWQKLDTAFIIDHAELLQWSLVCKWQQIDTSLLSTHGAYIDWNWLPQNVYPIDECVWINNRDKVVWHSLSLRPLSVDFLRKYCIELEMSAALTASFDKFDLPTIESIVREPLVTTFRILFDIYFDWPRLLSRRDLSDCVRTNCESHINLALHTSTHTFNSKTIANVWLTIWRRRGYIFSFF